MTRYLAARLVAILPVLFVISLLVFALQALAPGDPAYLLLEAAGTETITADTVACKREQLHLDDPLPARYWNWLSAAAGGDFGRSYRSYLPVSEMYRERFWNTALLAGVAMVLSASIAIPLGAFAAVRRGGVADIAAQIIAAVAEALPGFWIALIFALVFAVRLQWLPVFGTPTPRGIVLPALVLAIANFALLTRMTRSAVLDVLGQEYIRVARAKGLSGRYIFRHHVLPNAVTPIVSVAGLDLAHLLTGAAIVETVFAWPGVGKMAVDAARVRDVPTVAFFALAAGVIFVIANFIVDVIVALMEPSVRSV